MHKKALISNKSSITSKVAVAKKKKNCFIAFAQRIVGNGVIIIVHITTWSILHVGITDCRK